jgi:hypothetical protein
MMTLKACPRCGGYLFQEHDLGETSLVCLQCGCRRALASAGSTVSGGTEKPDRWHSPERAESMAA